MGMRLTHAHNSICYCGLLAFWNLLRVAGVYVTQGGFHQLGRLIWVRI